jgi:hypothetical protein
MRHLNRQFRIPSFFLFLLAAALAGCATGAPTSLAPSGPLGLAPAAAGPATVPLAEVGIPASATAAEVPWLSGLPPQERLRVLKWMLTVSDDRRLVSLFDDLRGPQDLELKERAVTARQRLEGMAAGLEKAGHRVPEAARGFALDRLEANVPPPNYFPPSLIKELERLPNDPEAARMLEEARRTSPQSSRPPGR